jgi:hypothetical protein
MRALCLVGLLCLSGCFKLERVGLGELLPTADEELGRRSDAGANERDAALAADSGEGPGADGSAATAPDASASQDAGSDEAGRDEDSDESDESDDEDREDDPELDNEED